MTTKRKINFEAGAAAYALHQQIRKDFHRCVMFGRGKRGEERSHYSSPQTESWFGRVAKMLELVLGVDGKNTELSKKFTSGENVILPGSLVIDPKTLGVFGQVIEVYKVWVYVGIEEPGKAWLKYEHHWQFGNGGTNGHNQVKTVEYH